MRAPSKSSAKMSVKVLDNGYAYIKKLIHKLIELSNIHPRAEAIFIITIIQKPKSAFAIFFLKLQILPHTFRVKNDIKPPPNPIQNDLAKTNCQYSMQRRCIIVPARRRV